MPTPPSTHRPEPAPPGCRCSGYGWGTPSFHAPDCPYRLQAERFEPDRPNLSEIVADLHGEHRRRGGRNFRVPRRDPRVRTAPHGDALDTRTRRFPLFTLTGEGEVERFGVGGSPPRLVSVAPRSWVRDRWFEVSGEKTHIFARIGDWASANDAGGRLTPGALKLAGARIMARGRPGDDSVAQAMADQIDFEWEERRWRVPDGDAAAVDNGMGC